MAKLVRQVGPLGTLTAPTLNHCYHASAVHDQRPIPRNGNSEPSSRDQFNNKTKSQQHSGNNTDGTSKRQIGEHLSRRDKIGFLLRTLMELPESKEAVYSALDAWVAWEQDFPIGPLRKALITLEKEQQWHRIVQVIKWILSKGQGTTMGIYGQLIRALDKDGRPEEAHEVWVKRIGSDLHSVPWQLCHLMISVYYRNNMLDRLVKLFKGLEAFDRKPPDKKIVKKVADAYELLGLVEEKERVLEKYKHLFTETGQKSPKAKNKKKEKSGQEK